jgi:ectoine hydroxylase-related dioxygenase (phytanoyl-CoA dioxygenase family)
MDIQAHVARVRRDGYTVVENAIAPSLVDALNEALEGLERAHDVKSANGFEGHKTVRIYNLLRYGAPFEQVPVHESVLPIVEGVLAQLGLSPELVRGFTPRLQELIGYGVYQGLIGHIDKKSPAQLLNGGGAFQSIWNRT